MKLNRYLLIVLVMITFSSLVFAETEPVDQVFKHLTDIDLKVPCIFNNQYCDSSIDCNATILYPNTSVWINNELMTRNVAYYNYTLDSANTSVIGTYQFQVICANGSDYGYEFSEFQITQSGMSGIGREVLVPAIVLISILIFCAFMAWTLPEEENALRLLFVGFALFLLVIMLQYANLATNEDTVGMTKLLDTTHNILLPVIIFVSAYFIIVKFLMPLILKINESYKKRKQGRIGNFNG